MPTRKGGNPDIINTPGKKNFHDCLKFGGYFITADFTGKDIKLTYRSHHIFVPEGKEHCIDLKFESCNKSGFIIYSFDNDGCNKDNFTEALNGKMNPAIYHYIKGAFHKHESHPATADALLQPFVSTGKISFADDERRIVDFYLQQYKDKFEDFIIYNSEETKAAKRQINSFININKGINSLGRIIENGNTIKGEQEYFEFLREYASKKGWIAKDFRREVKGYTDNINRLLKNVTVAYNLCTTGLGIKYGKWGIFLGVIGIFVSAAGILSSLPGSNNPPEETYRKQDFVNKNGSVSKDSLPPYQYQQTSRNTATQ